MMYFVWIALAVFCGHVAAQLVQDAMAPYFAARRIRKRMAEERRFFMQLGNVEWDDTTPAWTSKPGTLWNGRLN